MKSKNYRLHPVANRALQNVCFHLNRGTAAFYLGAGVDKQLAYESESGLEAPSWEKLLAETRPFPGATGAELKAYARDWPTETALSARLRLGEEEFKNKIAQSTNYAFKPDLRKPFTKQLSSLLLKTNIIVTPNYASHILDTLKLLIRKQRSTNKKEVIVLTREDLASFQFPVAEPNPNRIFLIHIHGRCVEGSSLIFDAWGYNVAINDDPYYHRFLYNLFSYRSVISIGTSWLDIPVRNQAALVFRTQSYQRPSHISLNYCLTKEVSKSIKADSAKRKWSNAMHAAYGVRMIVATSEKHVEVLKTLNQSELVLKSPPRLDDLTAIATFFDNCGDYESPIQQQWLLNNSNSRSDSPASRIQSTVIKLYKNLADGLKNDTSSWKTVAQLERHLRHFHYLYVEPSDPKNKCREELWDELARKLTKRIWKGIDDQLRFEFLIGQYEMDRVLPDKIKTFTAGSSPYKERLSFGKNVWVKSRDIESIKKLALRLLDNGWESMSSKLFLDAAMVTAENASGYDPQTNETILELAIRGGDIARSTGYFRREAKAETLVAMWLPDAQESRIRVLSKIRAAEFYPFGNDKTSFTNSAVVEPALMAGLTAGLLASHIRSLALHSKGEKELDKKLKASVKPLLEEAGIVWQDVPKTLLPYWENLIEVRLRRAFGKAIKGDYIS